jgi:hypothetical protein
MLVGNHSKKSIYMRRTTKFVCLSCLIIFQSCIKKGKVDAEFGNVPDRLKNVLVKIGSEKQTFSILTSQANTIVGKEGTIILIPKESIVDQDNNPVLDSVVIEIKEHFKLSDYLSSNLQTINNDSLLVTQGMVYISAKDRNGNELKIAKGATVRFEIPNPDYRNNPLIFIGKRDDSGSMNWNLPNEQTKTMVPLPIRFISKNKFPTECADFYGITRDTVNNQYYNYYGNVDEFENTLLATKEFQERFSWYCWKEILEIYVKNLDKNMWEIDEMVVQHLKKDSIERVEWSDNNPPPRVDGNPITKDQWSAHESLLESSKENSGRTIKAFKFFANQKLTKIDTTQLIDTTKIANLNSAFISYSAMDFGWVNVDYFYNDPLSIPIRLIAKTNFPTPLINLILKNKNVILSGIDKGNNEYWFTKSEDGYNKLPKGDTAIIIGIGIKQNEILFDKVEMIIGQQELVHLNLQSIQGEKLKEQLERLR